MMLIVAAVLAFGIFAIGALGLSIALRVKLRGSLEPLSRRTRWWVRGLTIGVIVGLGIVILLFQRALG